MCTKHTGILVLQNYVERLLNDESCPNMNSKSYWIPRWMVKEATVTWFDCQKITFKYHWKPSSFPQIQSEWKTRHTLLGGFKWRYGPTIQQATYTAWHSNHEKRTVLTSNLSSKGLLKTQNSETGNVCCLYPEACCRWQGILLPKLNHVAENSSCKCCKNHTHTQRLFRNSNKQYFEIDHCGMHSLAVTCRWL